MSPSGYKRRYAPPFGYARTTPGSRHSRPNVRFLGFSSAVPQGTDSQDGGADGPKVTRLGHSGSFIEAGMYRQPEISEHLNRNYHGQTTSEMGSEPPQPLYSITLFAWRSSDRGTDSPRARAVRRSMISSNFAFCSTARSAGLPPFKILSTWAAASLASSTASGP